MAREREIKCGDHVFTTRANPRVFVRCPKCSKGHRAPAIGDGWQGPAGGRQRAKAKAADHDTADAIADLASELLPPPASTVVKVTRAAHATARTAQGATKAPRRARSTRRPAERPTGELTPAQRAGRRGGLSDKRPAFLRRVGR